jgi:hypothetical protein
MRLFDEEWAAFSQFTRARWPDYLPAVERLYRAAVSEGHENHCWYLPSDALYGHEWGAPALKWRNIGRRTVRDALVPYARWVACIKATDGPVVPSGEVHGGWF